MYCLHKKSVRQAKISPVAQGHRSAGGPGAASEPERWRRCWGSEPRAGRCSTAAADTSRNTQTGATQVYHQILSSGPECNTDHGGVLLLLLHLDRRVGLSRADDALPLSIATSSRSTTAGPQRESGSLLGHTTAVTGSEPPEGAKSTSNNQGLTRFSCRIVLYVILAVACRPL